LLKNTKSGLACFIFKTSDFKSLALASGSRNNFTSPPKRLNSSLNIFACADSHGF
jgi:hypothetical protein